MKRTATLLFMILLVGSAVVFAEFCPDSLFGYTVRIKEDTAIMTRVANGDINQVTSADTTIVADTTVNCL